MSSAVRGAINTTFGQERTGSNLRSGRSPHNQIMAVGERAAQTGRCMKNPPAEENPHETRALARFAAVQAVEQARQAGLPLVHAIQQAAQQAWDGRIYAAATTQQINFLGEMSVATGVAAIKRKIPMGKIGVGDQNYFEELADIANRQYRGEVLFDQIFGEVPLKKILSWSKTPQGVAYLKAFDVVDPKQVTPYLVEKIELVKRMYPSYEARAAILKGAHSRINLKKDLI